MQQPSSAIEESPFLSSHHLVPNSPLKRKRVSSFPQARIYLPTPQLLLALPALLALPPTHPHHNSSLLLSLLAIRRCLRLRDHASMGMTPDLECRAWTAFVELGMKIVSADLNRGSSESEHWARALENEIGVAISKGLAFAQKHPSQRLYVHYLTLQHARFAYWQHNHKFARALLRRYVSSLSTTDPYSHHYSTHLALVSLALASDRVDIPSALHSLATIESLAERWGHSEVGLLCQVIKLRALVSAHVWSEVFPLLAAAEHAFDLSFPDSSKTVMPVCQQPESIVNVQPKPQPPIVTPLGARSLNIQLSDPKLSTVMSSSRKSEFRAALELHVLALGVLAHVQAGRNSDASTRIAKLHTALDSGVLDRDGIRDGVVEVPLGACEPRHAPLFIHTTHPRVFFHVAFLVSAVAMRDATGRRPKSKVFATEGLAICERERHQKGQQVMGRYLPWAGLSDQEAVEERLIEIEADLLCERIGICIQRSEFNEAEKDIARLIAHTRTHRLWEAYNTHITLYHAQLAHALHKTDRALECYRVASHLAQLEETHGRVWDKDGTMHARRVVQAKFIRLAAQAGEVGLRIGMARQQTCGQDMDEKFRRWGSDVAKECCKFGGTLGIVGRMLEACLTEEIIAAKNHLMASLNLTTHALDNHLRALVLAFASSHYLHTSSDYAEMMLSTARQLAAGLGASAAKSQDQQHPSNGSVQVARKVGNASLGLWVGQRFLELYRRSGKDKRARRQEAINAELTCALREIDTKGHSNHQTAEGAYDQYPKERT